MAFALRVSVALSRGLLRVFLVSFAGAEGPGAPDAYFALSICSFRAFAYTVTRSKNGSSFCHFSLSASSSSSSSSSSPSSSSSGNSVAGGDDAAVLLLGLPAVVGGSTDDEREDAYGVVARDGSGLDIATDSVDVAVVDVVDGGWVNGFD